MNLFKYFLVIVVFLVLGCQAETEPQSKFKDRLKQLTLEYEVSEKVPELISDLSFPLDEACQYYNDMGSWRNRYLKAYSGDPRIRKEQFNQFAKDLLKSYPDITREEVQDRVDFLC